MDTKIVDSIANIRLVQGTIRMDLMQISANKNEGQLKLEKSGELIMTPSAFERSILVLKEAESNLNSRPEKN